VFLSLLFAMAEIDFFNTPAKTAGGNPSILGFWMADFQINETRQRD
jgi:hypothetical protein